jgi:hypothetical protein
MCDGKVDQISGVNLLLTGLDPIFGYAVFVGVLDVAGGGSHFPVARQTPDVWGVGQFEWAE